MPAPTTSRQPLTSADLDAFEQHDEWLGFGFIGERSRARETVAAGDSDYRMSVDSLAEIDTIVLRLASERGWSVERLFAWANSRDGRFAGDELFGSYHVTDRSVEFVRSTMKGY